MCIVRLRVGKALLNRREAVTVTDLHRRKELNRILLRVSCSPFDLRIRSYLAKGPGCYK